MNVKKITQDCPLCWRPTEQFIVEEDGFKYARYFCKKCNLKWAEVLPKDKYIIPE